jgi:hypothetical protein
LFQPPYAGFERVHLRRYPTWPKQWRGKGLLGASGSAGMQAIAGVAAVVLGSLAIAMAGVHDMILVLVALLSLGATLVVTGSSLSETVLSLMTSLPSTGTARRGHSSAESAE